MTSFARASLPVAFFALALGCKNNNIKSSQDNQYVSEMVGSQGQRLTLDDGTSVDIPANALAETHEVTLGRVGSGYPPFQDLTANSAVYSLEPHDLPFQSPVQLIVPAAQGNSIAFATDSGPWMQLQTLFGGGSISAMSMQAGFFAAVTGSTAMVMGNDGSAGGPSSSNSGDGTLVRSGLGGRDALFAMGESYVFFLGSAMDQFGVQTTTVQAAALDTMDAPVVVATPVSDRAAGETQLAAIGDYAYWSESTRPTPQNPMGMSTIYRAKPGGTKEMVAASVMMGGLAAAAGSLVFLDASNNVTLYNADSGTLDPTVYGTSDAMGGGLTASFTRSEDHVFFLSGGGSSPYEIWAGDIGSPAVDTGMNFPGAAMLSAIGASGATFVIVTRAGSQNNILKFDTSDPTSGAVTVGSFAGSVDASMIAIDGGAVYVAAYANGGPTGDLVKYDIASGMQTQLGKYLAQGGSRPVMVNSQYAFVAEMNQTGMGMDLYRWAR